MARTLRAGSARSAWRSRAALQYPTRARTRRALLSPNRLAVHDHGIDAACGLQRIIEARGVDDRGGIEQRQIRKGAFAHYAAILQPEALCGQPGHLVDGDLE